jgi:hypothetical protein
MHSKVVILFVFSKACYRVIIIERAHCVATYRLRLFFSAGRAGLNMTLTFLEHLVT